MRRRWRPIGGLAAVLALAAPAGAQAPGDGATRAPAAPPAGEARTPAGLTPEAARAQAAEAAEDLALARILAGMRLSATQMERLLPFLESAQKQLRESEAAAAAALAGPQPRLAETRAALLRGGAPSTRAEGQIAEQARIHTGKLRQLRADLVSSLRRTLSGLLAPEQSAALGETARALDVGQRAARFVARSTAADAGGRGGRGGGPVAGMERLLDRARGVSDADYPQARALIAQRLARMGGRPGRDGEGGAASAPLDPRMQQQLEPILALIDRSRRMSDAQYRNGRADLALQLWSKRAELAGTGIDPAATSEAIDELLDRYFLSPRMIGALRARMEGRR